jgi:Icc-related predicted phosphoesterase
MALFKSFRRNNGGRGTGFRCFFATDIHGSDRCFRKFLAAASVYEVDALILGGDIAGKAIVPLQRHQGDTVAFAYQGREHRIPETALESTVQEISDAGMYPRFCSPDEMERLRDDEEFREGLFADIIVEQVAGWCRLADERLDPAMRLVITPGNDDPYEIDPVLTRSPRVECPERSLLALGPITLASLGNTNHTPWHTPREFDEYELRDQIDEMMAGAPAGPRLVFNFHCPPYGSGLDTVAKLDEDFRPVVSKGHQVEVPAGSTAVREAIERYVPVVGLHGHIHEAAGHWRHGRTICLNPGSDYGSGVLKGALVQFDEEGNYRDHLLTTG